MGNDPFAEMRRTITKLQARIKSQREELRRKDQQLTELRAKLYLAEMVR